MHRRHLGDHPSALGRPPIPDRRCDLLGCFFLHVVPRPEQDAASALRALAPEKDFSGIRRAMGRMRVRIDEAKEAAQRVNFNLTQKGMDFLGYRALKGLLSALGKATAGSHDTPHLATGVEADAASKPYQFGDTLNLDIPATLKNAIEREGLQVPLELDYGDLMVHQAEYRSSCATVLMLDCSHSMILYGEDRITPAKTVALALTELITTKYPKDHLSVILFGDRAERLSLADLPYVEAGPYHTNTREALQLARALLARQKQPNKQIFLITDGKPSAITEGGRIYKNPFGLDMKIVNRTLEEADQCRRQRVVITTFMLATDPMLTQFVEKLTQINRGRAFFASPYNLGEFVLADYIKNRRSRIR